MKQNLTFLFFVFLALTGSRPAIAAQQQPGAESPLTDQQLLGRRLFRQRCAVCHYPPTPGARVYGPTLYKGIIDGKENAMRDLIMNGSKGRMPGFKYGLKLAEVDA